MIYLDYSATTPINSEVLDTYVKVSNSFLGNANSLHKLGLNSKKLIDEASMQILNLLKLEDHDIIYTSGASEANNLALKGIIEKYSNRGKSIITTHFEHSSINETLKYLENHGFIINYVKCDENGLVDLDNLKSLLNDDVILVTTTAVNSEIGIKNQIEKIANILKEYPKCFYHVDATQSIGKVNIDFSNVDLISASAHKIYGPLGVGMLIKRKKIELEPLIHGGKSTTIYRSGTPTVALIASFAKALRLIINEIDNNYKYITELNKYLKDEFKKLNRISINSSEYSIPHILNISVDNMMGETLLRALESKDIYVSTKTACSTEDYSNSIYILTNDLKKAKSSIRISISHLTTKMEIKKLIEVIKEVLN